MDEFTVAEESYKNGYAQGRVDTVSDFIKNSWFVEKGGIAVCDVCENIISLEKAPVFIFCPYCGTQKSYIVKDLVRPNRKNFDVSSYDDAYVELKEPVEIPGEISDNADKIVSKTINEPPKKTRGRKPKTAITEENSVENTAVEE